MIFCLFYHSIIRCPDINKAKEYFTSNQYEWIEEKHGKGPKHFHGSVGLHQVEIYPLRKAESSNIQMSLEFYFDIPNIDVLPEKHREEKHMIWPMQDPECRKFVVALSKQE